MHHAVLDAVGGVTSFENAGGKELQLIIAESAAKIGHAIRAFRRNRHQRLRVTDGVDRGQRYSVSGRGCYNTVEHLGVALCNGHGLPSTIGTAGKIRARWCLAVELADK